MKRLVILTLLVSCIAASPDKGYEVGDKAADFKLKNVDGKMISMADFKEAKGFIVIFDCNTCPVSRKYKARIAALSKKYAPLKFQLIAINSNDPGVSPGDSFEENVDEAKANGYDYPYLTDATQEIAHTYGATNTPHVYVLTRSADGLKVAYIGSIDDNTRGGSGINHKYVEDAVDALLAGKAVPTPRTKAIGCSIKWRDS